MKEKRIICLKGLENTGKSGTIRELLKLLEPKSNQKARPHNLPDVPDCQIGAEVRVKGKRIGLAFDGDVGDDLEKILKDMADNGCEIIFCTSRTKWGSHDAVVKIAGKCGYAIIWTAPYTVEPPRTEDDETEMNKMKAKHLEGFI